MIERESRYWIEDQAGLKEQELFEQGVKKAWDWASASLGIRWFTDGERRYGQELWKLASVYLPYGSTPKDCAYHKVGREGLEVAMKIKGWKTKSRVGQSRTSFHRD